MLDLEEGILAKLLVSQCFTAEGLRGEMTSLSYFN